MIIINFFNHETHLVARKLIHVLSRRFSLSQRRQKIKRVREAQIKINSKRKIPKRYQLFVQFINCELHENEVVMISQEEDVENI